MRTIKLMLLTFGIFLLSATVTKSQETEKAKPSPRQILELRRKFNVPAKTALKVDSILTVFKDESNVIYNNPNISQTEKRAMVSKLVKAKYISLQKLLTDNQITELLPTSELKEAKEN